MLNTEKEVCVISLYRVQFDIDQDEVLELYLQYAF